MEQKDKIEGLKHYSQIHRSQMDGRRTYEYRVLFATLTFYVLCTAAVGSETFKLGKEFVVGVGV